MTGLTFTPYAQKHREAILTLFHYNRNVHSHLDWYQVGDWLYRERGSVMLAWDDNSLVGFIGISAPMNGASWIRLFAIENKYNREDILQVLWGSLRDQLAERMIQTVNILCISEWIIPALQDVGFEHLDDIITLFRADIDPPVEIDHSAVLRSVYPEDIRQIIQVDTRSFQPPWQMNAADIRQAQRYAASCTVAEMNGVIVGYQLSTRNNSSGHLARLAVLPDLQGKKIGALLVNDLIQRFTKRGIHSLTVNTQSSNPVSQRLYARYGFVRNGFDLPVWSIQL